MTLPDPQAAQDLTPAWIGVIGAVVGALAGGGATLIAEWLRHRATQLSKGTEARSAREQAKADAVKACQAAACRLRVATENYDRSSADESTAREWAIAKSELDVARVMLADEQMRDKVSAWQKAAKGHSNSIVNRGEMERAWEECLDALGLGWNHHLDQVEKTAERRGWLHRWKERRASQEQDGSTNGA